MENRDCSDMHSTGCFSGFGRLRTKLISRLTPSTSGQGRVSQNSVKTSSSATATARPTDSGLGSVGMIGADKDTSLYGVPCDFCRDFNSPDMESLPSYEHGTKGGELSPKVIHTIETKVDELSDELRELSLKIHDHPELGYKEFYAHDTLTAFMTDHGFKVTPHYLGLETAWRAEWEHGSGGRVLGVNSEMDALPNIGHACGHNLIAIAGVGLALAIRHALEKHDVAGKVVLLGTPSEEGGGGKIILLERGGYKDMDLCLMCHPGSGNVVGAGSSLATQPIVVEYFGHPAHAAAAPWEGQNALDAAVLAYNSVSMLRQQIRPECRVHGIIEGRNWEPNVIPDYAKMRWIVRAPSYDEMTTLIERVKACIEAAAMAASCRVEMKLGVAYFDLRQNSALSGEFAQLAKARYGLITTYAAGAIGGSTDFGNVTYELPAFHPAYPIPTVPQGGNHTKEYTEAAGTVEAHKRTLTMIKALSLIAFRAVEDAGFYQEVKKAFADSRSTRAPKPEDIKLV